jgi:uncharacterized coiled-coil DUF342 family protein
MEWILGILTLVLPVATGAVSYLAGKRKRNNDFLVELQGSIDLLSEKYTKALNELTELRRENMELKLMQERMMREIEALKQENAELNEKLANVKRITVEKK